MALHALSQNCGKKETATREKGEKKKGKEKESLPETLREISKQPMHSQQSFDSVQGGEWVTKEQGESLYEPLKEKSMI